MYKRLACLQNSACIQGSTQMLAAQELMTRGSIHSRSRGPLFSEEALAFGPLTGAFNESQS